MPSEVRVPTLGESVVEATVGAWLKREGDQVAAGDAVVQLETEKVNVDVAAESNGVLGSIQHGEGDTVHPGDVLATVTEAAAASSSAPAPPTAPASAAASPSAEPASPGAAAPNAGSAQPNTLAQAE